MDYNKKYKKYKKYKQKYLALKHQPNINNIKQTTKDISIYRPIESPNLIKVKNNIMNKLSELGLNTS